MIKGFHYGRERPVSRGSCELTNTGWEPALIGEAVREEAGEDGVGDVQILSTGAWFPVNDVGTRSGLSGVPRVSHAGRFHSRWGN